ncbi:group 1 glycosyl transferase, partial [Cytobacillus firmus DS1]
NCAKVVNFYFSVYIYIKGKHPYDYSWIKNKNEERIFYDSLFKYIEKLPSKKNIHFEGWSDDLSDWYRKIGYILSTSDFESFHLSVAEGMSSGAVPVVRNWNGASDLYPPPFIFTTIDEAVKIINKKINPGEIQTLTKNFVLKNFEKSKLLPEIEKLLTS